MKAVGRGPWSTLEAMPSGPFEKRKELSSVCIKSSSWVRFAQSSTSVTFKFQSGCLSQSPAILSRRTSTLAPCAMGEASSRQNPEPAE